jgi:hypothetical protein
MRRLLPVACKTRRASHCAPCAEVYRADTFSSSGAVLFNAYAPELWRRFTITLRRTLARRAGLTGKAFAGWGEPVYPDTVTSLMTKLIAAHNKPDDGPRPRHPLPHAQLHARC